MAPAAAKMQLRSPGLSLALTGTLETLGRAFPYPHQRISVSMPPFLAADGVQEDTCRKVKNKSILHDFFFFKPQENRSVGLDA